jgi:hypothetical protein
LPKRAGLPRSYRLAQRVTACGGLLCPGRASQLAPLSPRVLGVSAISPAFIIQVALTMTSSAAHMAGFTIPPSAAPLTTRNCGGGDTPSLPSFPGGPGGPCGPGGPGVPGAPASPRSPLSPLSPFMPQPLSIRAESKAQIMIEDHRPSAPRTAQRKALPKRTMMGLTSCLPCLPYFNDRHCSERRSPKWTHPS